MQSVALPAVETALCKGIQQILFGCDGRTPLSSGIERGEEETCALSFIEDMDQTVPAPCSATSRRYALMELHLRQAKKNRRRRPG
ncbi:hypothetical protein BC939DRAFT_33984 [Gamsiella multidivaricata]|uniref:uncharacterized protein n=1 Tax=Gamsiella multidivaricata TaxID=101098 RepID=UPI00221ECCE1|nr:uncharacterized protein BC939DRAFT_33984 [Gamsiella multidivaricata]KAI7816643.1 hypothetical protein BC939DRAFT_33984 [Gamsiella multidivaricata]